jgi:GT2 family glycosyltransferase
VTAIDEVVEVVVVTYNSAALIADLVSSLPAGMAGVRWHLTFVDNASSDDTVQRLRRLAPGARLVQTGYNAGYAGGINAGVAAAGPHTAVLILNPDVRLDPGCVATLIGELRQPGTGLAVPLLVDAAGERIDSQRREPTLLRAAGDALLGATRAGRIGALGQIVSDGRRYRAPTVVDWAEGSTLLISAECWARVGPWDESYFLFSEETEFALRARDAGFATRFTPHARATHLEGGSSGSPSQWPLVVANWVRLYRRRNGVVRASAFWAIVVLREASRAVLGRQTNRRALRMLLDPKRLCERPGPHTLRY